jgi:hypothetical protein
MKTSKRFMQMALAGIVGMGAIVTSAIADDTLVTLCFRNRTIQVPSYLVPRYIAVAGTTPGACVVTP